MINSEGINSRVINSVSGPNRALQMNINIQINSALQMNINIELKYNKENNVFKDGIGV